jgi:HK97 family phage major capsid protein/HK97 family phage prohead protease
MPKMKLKPQFRHFERADVTLDAEKRTVEFSFSSEEPVNRWFGKEILSHDKSAADMQRLNDGANLLFNHNWDAPIGVMEKAWIGNDKRGYVRARFSKNPQADQIFKDVQDGILRNVSFGYEVKELKREKTTEDGADEYLATKWMPFEVSIVTVPADQTVGIGRGIDMSEKEISVIGELPEKVVKAIQELEKVTAILETNEPEKTLTVTETTKGKSMTPEEIKAMQEKARQEERDRSSAITALCEKHKMDGEFTRSLVNGGKSLDEAREAVLSKISVRQAPVSATPDVAPVGLTEKEIRQFSFIKIIRALSNPGDARAQEEAKFEREVSEAGAKLRGKQSEGFFVPMDILAHRGRRDLTKGSATGGGDTIATEMKGFIEMLKNKSALQRAGATVLNGLVGDLAIPKQTGGATAYWVAENVDITESQQTFGQVLMAPKGLGAFTDISRKLLLQSSIDVENLVRSDLATVVALALDLAGLYGLGSSDQPTGLKTVGIANGLNNVDLVGANPTWPELVSMETAIASDNADVANMKYLVSAAGRGYLKSTAKYSNTGTPMWDGGDIVNGYGAVVSNQVTDGDYWFGNFADLLIGFWSGLDLIVDPYTGAKAGTLRLIALQDVDVAVRHAESFCYANATPLS